MSGTVEVTSNQDDHSDLRLDSLEKDQHELLTEIQVMHAEADMEKTEMKAKEVKYEHEMEAQELTYEHELKEIQAMHAEADMEKMEMKAQVAKHEHEMKAQEVKYEHDTKEMFIGMSLVVLVSAVGVVGAIIFFLGKK